jgi:glutamate/tyrosine decarboxylase-like PLP-dependent enzyme
MAGRYCWIHVGRGAFGLCTRATQHFKHYTDGIELADSWVTNGHEWLNFLFNSAYDNDGEVAPSEFEVLHLMLAWKFLYLHQIDWNVKWSCRARGFAAYASLRSLGRQGICKIIENSCILLQSMVNQLIDHPGIHLCAPVFINQSLIRFLAPPTDMIIILYVLLNKF